MYEHLKRVRRVKFCNLHEALDEGTDSLNDAERIFSRWNFFKISLNPLENTCVGSLQPSDEDGVDNEYFKWMICKSWNCI